MSFRQDLRAGHRTEKYFAEKLKEMGYTNIKFNDAYSIKKLKEYDLSADVDGVTLTFEVKGDTVGQRTGNAFIEFRGRNDFPTGISTTKADVFVYVVGDYIYCIPTQELKDIMKANKGKYRIVAQGRDRFSSAIGMLVPLSAIKQYII